jgi:hypothetical protein
MVEREYRDFIIDMIEAADMVASFISIPRIPVSLLAG